MLPQLSVPVQLLVVENVHPEPVSLPTVPLAVTPLHPLFLPDALPIAAAMSAVVGLHASPEAAASVITGLVVSRVEVTVCEPVPGVTQVSGTVQLLVVENVHPEPVSAPTVPLAVKPLLQLSLTVAPPNAAAICASVGLHPSPEAAASVICGLVVSRV